MVSWLLSDDCRSNYLSKFSKHCVELSVMYSPTIALLRDGMWLMITVKGYRYRLGSRWGISCGTSCCPTSCECIPVWVKTINIFCAIFGFLECERSDLNAVYIEHAGLPNECRGCRCDSHSDIADLFDLEPVLRIHACTYWKIRRVWGC